MQIKTTVLVASVMLGTLITAPVAQAAFVQVNGSFNTPTASDPYFYRRIYNQDNEASPAIQLPTNLNNLTDSVSYFGWGVDVIESVITQQKIQSHFWFDGLNSASVPDSPITSVAVGSTFSLGSFTYTNEQTIFDGGLVEINFQMDITIDGLNLAPVNYRIEIDNTQNNLPDSNDTARLISVPSDTFYSIGGINYLLSFNGFSRDSGNSFETWASLPEDGQTTAEIYATLTTAVVPVPAAIWLFGSGLIGLIGLTRKRKNT